MRSVSRWFPVESGLPLMAESISMTNAVIPPTFSRPRNASGQRDFQGDVCSSIATNAKMLSSDEMFRHRSHVKTLATPVWSYASMRVPKWRQQKSNLGHGSAAQCGQGSPSADHRRTAQKEPKLVKLVLLLGEDPHFITLAVPGSRRTGPCDPGGAPHGRGEHGRPRCPVHRIPRRGKRVNRVQRGGTTPEALRPIAFRIESSCCTLARAVQHAAISNLLTCLHTDHGWVTVAAWCNAPVCRTIRAVVI